MRAPHAAVVALLLTVAAGPRAHAEPSVLPPPQVQEWAVDSGTTGMLVEDHRVPVASVRLAFPVGTWSPWGRRHHLEEAFEIQMRDGKGELRRRADLLAIEVALSPQERSSDLKLTCRKEDLASALALVRDVLFNRDFDRDELKRRRQARKFAWTASRKEAEFVVGQAAVRILFREGDPRAQSFEEPPPLATDPVRLAETRDALIRFPGRIIGFAGDLTLDEARRAARGLLPDPSASAPPDASPVFGPLSSASERPRDRTVGLERLTQVYFAYGRDSLSYEDADWPASEIADHVLGGHFNSRLMVALRQEGGETYGAAVQNFGGLQPSLYGIRTFTRTANAARTEGILRDVLRRFHDDGITEEERADAGSCLVGRRAFDRQAPSQILSTRMTERLSGLPDGFTERMAERAAAVPLGELNAFIGRFFDPDVFTMLKVEAP
jgi:zinc protease